MIFSFKSEGEDDIQCVMWKIQTPESVSLYKITECDGTGFWKCG